MKKMCKAILAAAAIAALAVPAMAAGNNKLVVKDAAGTSNVLTVTDAGQVGQGTDAPFGDIQATSTSTSNAFRGVSALQISTGNQGGVMNFMKAGGVPGTKTQPTDNNYIGVFSAFFYSSTLADFDRSAQFGFRNDGPSSAGVFPTGIMFSTGSHASGTSDLTEKMRISSGGNVVVGNLGGTAAGDLLPTATNGFLYIPNVAGALTACATAATYTGHTALWYDTTNNKVCTCRAGVLKCSAVFN